MNRKIHKVNKNNLRIDKFFSIFVFQIFFLNNPIYLAGRKTHERHGSRGRNTAAKSGVTTTAAKGRDHAIDEINNKRRKNRKKK